MAFVCLPKDLADKIKKALVSREIDPTKLAEMTTEQRHSFFEKYVGKDYAKPVNTLLESKLLLKDQRQGFATWAKQIVGMKEPAKRSLLDKIEKLDKVLNPTETKQFLADLVEQRIGAQITPGEGIKISELSKIVRQAKDTLDATPSLANEKAYGNALLDIQDYIHEAGGTKPTWQTIALEITNLPRGLQTTLDDSWLFRQGWGMMTSKEFWGGAIRQFQKNGEKGYLLSDKAVRDLQAEIAGSPYYDLAKKAKLRLTNLGDDLKAREEAIMFSDMLEKVPGVGELVKASNRGFTGIANDVRFSAFKNLVEAARLKGEDVSPGSKSVADIADVINNLTGSGNLGKLDRYSNISPIANTLLYSARKWAADIQTFNPVWYATLSPTARLYALRQMLGSTAMAVGLLSLAGAFGASVEKNPDSADFGTMKIGKTRIDVTGGKKTLAILLARLVTGKTKSSTTGKISSLTSGKFGASTRLSIVQNYIRNKLSPNASLVTDWLAGEDSSGKKFSWKGAIGNRVQPLIVQDTIKLLNSGDSIAKSTLITLFNLFGAGTSTY